MNIIAFAATSSSTSINKQLISYSKTLIAEMKNEKLNETAEVEIIDINDYELPLFSEDKEKEIGQPDLAQDFLNKIGTSDALIISFAEHNGTYTAAYKNLFDWASRINPKVFQDKPMLLLATSPGPGGAATVLAQATTSAPYFDGKVMASFSLPLFYDNFDIEKGVLMNLELKDRLTKSLQNLLEQ